MVSEKSSNRKEESLIYMYMYMYMYRDCTLHIVYYFPHFPQCTQKLYLYMILHLYTIYMFMCQNACTYV